MISQFGRKVLFVNPPKSLGGCFLEDIFKNEFEIYLLNGIDKLEKVLDIFSNAIVFFNIDEGMGQLEWIDYIRSLKANSHFEQVTMGVFSKKDSKTLRDVFLMDIGIKGGYILLNKNQWETVGIINQVLTANEAKGRRTRVRVDLNKHIEKKDALEVKIYTKSGSLYKGEIKSFSALGFLVEIGQKHKDIFVRENVDKIIFYVDGRDHHVEGVHLDRISETDFFLKFKHLDEAERDYVQEYVFNSLQKSFQKLVGAI